VKEKERIINYKSEKKENIEKNVKLLRKRNIIGKYCKVGSVRYKHFSLSENVYFLEVVFWGMWSFGVFGPWCIEYLFWVI
jgi:hypothetical protein